MLTILHANHRQLRVYYVLTVLSVRHSVIDIQSEDILRSCTNPKRNILSHLTLPFPVSLDPVPRLTSIRSPTSTQSFRPDILTVISRCRSQLIRPYERFQSLLLIHLVASLAPSTDPFTSPEIPAINPGQCLLVFFEQFHLRVDYFR